MSDRECEQRQVSFVRRSVCDCSDEHRRHPAHEAVHATLDELLTDGVIVFSGVNEERKAAYKVVRRPTDV
jgi:hypothetical protein